MRSPHPGGPRPVSTALFGAFAPLRTFEQGTPAERRRILELVRDAGLTTVLTEGPAIPPRLADEVRAMGLRLGGGMACFSDHASSFRPVPESLRPIGPDGRPRPTMEWYRGIVPTDPGYVRDLVAACRRAAADPALDLFSLDFIRWPLHWELELRAGATPIDASFDRGTLQRFRDELGVDVPVDDAGQASALVEDRYASEWAAFKCRTITGVLDEVVAAVRSVNAHLPVAAFVVPGTDEERRRLAGQDVGDLGARVDLLLPMTYHAVLGRPASWVGDVIADIGARTSTPVVPVVQVTADRAISGASDWGVPFPANELGEAIDTGLAAGGAGFVVFPAHGLDPARSAIARRRTKG